jgi:hypothetical protein
MIETTGLLALQVQMIETTGLAALHRQRIVATGEIEQYHNSTSAPVHH